MAKELKTEQEKKPFPIQVLGDRVMVLPIMEESDIVEVKGEDGQITFKRKGSGILLSDKEVFDEKQRRSLTLAKCIVISVGEAVGQTSAAIQNTPIQTADIVYCFPTTQEAKMHIDGVEYWIYKEKAIVAKDI